MQNIFLHNSYSDTVQVAQAEGTQRWHCCGGYQGRNSHSRKEISYPTMPEH